MSALSQPAATRALTAASDATSTVRPFLKWAGGKRQLLPRLRAFYPPAFGAYHEPFIGSGAVFFDLVASGRLDGHRARLTDSNVDLIGCYRRVQDETEAVIERLRRLAAAHTRDPDAHYYRTRDRKFNPARREILNGRASGARAYSADLAAMLIYLNRTGFNGLFRLNAKGMFNVPLGRYTNPKICDPDNLREVARVLSRPGVSVRSAPYEETLESANPGDFIYFDPPYAPLSATARFTSYTPQGFSSTDQVQLQHTVVRLADRGCWVLLSNSTAPDVAALYDGNAAAERAGLAAHKVPARRAINSVARRRGAVMEYVITNIPEQANRDAPSCR